MAFFIKLGLSLAVGLLVARRLRGFIQKGVTRSIPMKDRMAEDFLNRLSNRSTIIGIVLALVLSSLSYWGLSKVWPQSKTTAVHYSSTRKDNPPVQREEKDADEEAQQPEELTLNPLKTPDLRPQAAKEESPSSTQPQRARSGDWFIQIGAFSVEANAYDLYQSQQQQSQLRVYLAESSDLSGKWKILLGPFPSVQAARTYRDQHAIPGFPRNAVGLRLL